MSIRHPDTTHPLAGSPNGWTWTFVILLGTCTAAGPLWAQDTASDDVDRSFYFIERLSEATDLFNAGKLEEALAVFQSLVANDPTFDEDGHAALGAGDCLVRLGRYDEARSVYAAASAAHPGIQATVADRLAELDIANPSSESLTRLRTAAASGRAGDQCRLGRALQKRAQELLAEAVKAFRAATTSESADLLPRTIQLSGNVAVLEELSRDLSALVEQTESILSGPRDSLLVGPGPRDRTISPGFTTQRQKAEYLLHAPDGRRVEVQLRGESDGDSVQVTINGKPVGLTASERRMLQRHQDRMYEILMEAAGRSGGK